jgi:hypothetical protein
MIDERNFYALLAQRGNADIEESMAEAGAIGPRTRIGDNTCSSLLEGTVCLRTSRTLTVGVVSPHPAAQIAGVVDEAWTALG